MQTHSRFPLTGQPTPPPLTPSTQHSDAQHTTGPENPTIAPVILSPANPLYLPSQDTIASSRSRRSIKRPERLKTSPTRGRNAYRPQRQENSQESPPCTIPAQPLTAAYKPTQSYANPATCFRPRCSRTPPPSSLAQCCTAVRPPF